MAKLTPVIVGDVYLNEELAADNIVQAQAAVAVESLSDIRDDSIIVEAIKQQEEPDKLIVLRPGNANDENIKNMLSTLNKASAETSYCSLT